MVCFVRTTEKYSGSGTDNHDFSDSSLKILDDKLVILYFTFDKVHKSHIAFT